MKPWIAFFSQTGSEIYNVSKKLNRFPDKIITNRPSIDGINQSLLNEYKGTINLVPDRPSVDVYHHVLQKNAFVTLHGWLRIVPEEICNTYEIYNLHPANLLLHPHLKGKDPQRRAVAELLKQTGNTIHRCTSVLDGGEILKYSTVDIEGMFEFEVFDVLHKDATNLWFNFLNKHLLYK